MADKKKRLPTWVKTTVIPLAIAIVISAALLITNAFIPVRYLSAYFVSAKPNAEGELRVTFLDVGFGDSTLIELPNGKTVLIDGGDGVYSHELSLLKYLNFRGVDTIDFLICSSVKSEHCGGLAEILKYKTVNKAFIPYCLNSHVTDEYNAFITELAKKGVDCEYAGIGKGYADSQTDCFFTFLSPTDKDSPMSEYAEMNTSGTEASIEKASVVTWLQYGETAFAFTSDSRKETLKSITEHYEVSKIAGQSFCKFEDYDVKLEECKILTVPAHGGEYNTYAPWYDLIKPECAVLSVGENFAGYPSTISLFDVGAYVQPLFTREKGNIVITASAVSYSVL